MPAEPKIYLVRDGKRGFYVGPKYNPDHEWTWNIYKAKWYKRPGDAKNAIGYAMGNYDARFKVGDVYSVETYRLELMHESTKNIKKER